MFELLVPVMAFLSISLTIVIIMSIFFRWRAGKFKKQFSKDQKIRKLPFEINDLIKALGGVKNIVRARPSLSKLIINLNDSLLIDLKALKELSPKGIIKNSGGVILIFGNLSYSISIYVNTIIKNTKN